MPEKTYIIIVTWNGRDFIRECLTSIFRQNTSDFGVIVVDNESSDNTVEIIEKEFTKVLLVKNTANAGFAVANNQGIKKALSLGADYVVLLNQDTEVADNFIQAGREYMDAHGKTGLMSPLIYYPGGKKIWYAGSKIYRGLEILRHPTTKIGDHIHKKLPLSEIDRQNSADWIPACALFVRREVFEKIGFLDEHFFMYGEDVDFSLRALRCGYELGIATDTSIIHKEAIDRKMKKNLALLKKIAYKTRARYTIVKRYYSFPEKCYYLIKLTYTPIFQMYYAARKIIS